MTDPYFPHFTNNCHEVEKVGDLSALLLPSWSNYTSPAPAPFLEITTIETATALLQESVLTATATNNNNNQMLRASARETAAEMPSQYRLNPGTAFASSNLLHYQPLLPPDAVTFAKERADDTHYDARPEPIRTRLQRVGSTTAVYVALGLIRATPGYPGWFLPSLETFPSAKELASIS
ncbi:uncharacterized protein PG986_009698 [Apiospora aurea]|uniref:Uncharacterized protein n=1 Tax=Apiospora aurea TaxID=335848 RepID=A0ABR1Q8E4_9PEZI